MQIAEETYLDKQHPLATTFNELTQEFLAYAHNNKQPWNRDASSILKLNEAWDGKPLAKINPAPLSVQDLAHGEPKPFMAAIPRQRRCIAS